MLSSRYLYLHEALDLGPMWLKQDAQVQPADTPPATAPGATRPTSAVGDEASVSSAPQPARQHRQHILQQLAACAHPPSATTAPPPTAHPATTKQDAAPTLGRIVDIDDMADLPAALAACTACALHRERRQPLLGQGSVPARLMVISLSPSPQDDATRQLFSGDVGRLLHNMLATIDVDEHEVFYTSQVKCTPNVSLRVPSEAITACRPFLQQQLTLVQPQAVLLLGQAFARIPADTLQAYLHHLPYAIVPHPARLLRQSHLKAQAWVNLQQLAIHLHRHHTQSSANQPEPQNSKP